MADPETLDVASADPLNYQAPGRVSLWFRKAGSLSGGDWLDLGNAIDPSIAQDIKRLEHFSVRRGVRAKDRSIVSERAASLKFTVDEVTRQTLMLVFGVTPGDEQASTVEVLEGKKFTNPGSGETIDLGMRDITEGSVVVTDTTQEDPTTYAETTDYTVDEATGILTIAANPGALADESAVPEIYVRWTKNVATQSFEIFPGTEVAGEARFQILTPDGVQYVIEFGNVQVIADGDIKIGDGSTFQTFPLRLDILVDTDGVLGTGHIVDAADRLPLVEDPPT